MTLFNIVTWYNYSAKIFAGSWQEAIDIFINDAAKANDDFTVSDIEHVLYGTVLTKNGARHIINDALVVANDNYPAAAPWEEVLAYLETK
jgi:hypothetical protein